MWILSQPPGHLFSYAGGTQRRSHSFIDEVWQKEIKQPSSQQLAFDKTREGGCCKRAEIILIYRVCSFVSAPSSAENAPERRCPACGELKCHLPKFKGQLGFEPLGPYQGAVVLAVLVGQVCNGGCNAGTEELLPLVEVALMDFIEELAVSAHINNG